MGTYVIAEVVDDRFISPAASLGFFDDEKPMRSISFDLIHFSKKYVPISKANIKSKAHRTNQTNQQYLFSSKRSKNT